jgi:hypothetical protein
MVARVRTRISALPARASLTAKRFGGRSQASAEKLSVIELVI